MGQAEDKKVSPRLNKGKSGFSWVNRAGRLTLMNTDEHRFINLQIRVCYVRKYLIWKTFYVKNKHN